MKQYNAVVKITWSNYGVEASSRQEAIKVLKETYKDQYGIELDDNEIIEIVEESK